MTRHSAVSALVHGEDWPSDVREAVLASLHGQVAHILGEDQPLRHETEMVLVVTAPVAFADGAVDRLRRMTAHPGRVVTRVLVPDEEPTAVSLWSAGWLTQQGLAPDSLPGRDLDFDRDRLPHDDPYARAWVRAEDIGVAPWRGVISPWRWRRSEGARLRLSQAMSYGRSVLGRIRRARSLARQRGLQHG